MKCGIVLDSVKWILNGWTKQLGCSKISLACPQKWERPQKTANITMVLTAIAKPEHTHTTLHRIYTLSKSLYGKGSVSTPAALRESNLHFLKHQVSSSQRTQSERGWTGWERREGDQFEEGLKGMWEGDKRTEGELRWEWNERDREMEETKKKETSLDKHIILFSWSLATTVPPSAPSLWFLIIRCSSLHASFLLPSCCSCLYTHLSPCLLFFIPLCIYLD